MKNKFLCFTPAWVLLLLLCSCQVQHSFNGADTEAYWDDLARYLAGMRVSENSGFAKLAASESYKVHTRYMDEFWGRVERETISLIIPWRNKHMVRTKENIAFYPLSGADFINFYTLYPDSRYYLMIAMEEPGQVPEPMKNSLNKAESLLSTIRRTIQHYGKLNYFQTKIMYEELSSFGKTGTTPVLLVFMARLGLKVVDVTPVGVDSNGSLLPLDDTVFARGEKPVSRGVKYIFYAPNDPKPRVLLYLSMRLNSKAIDPSTPIGKFLSRMDKVKTIMKSAVYLLHMRGYEALKDFVVGKSVMIVQDDSGVPFKDLNNGKWDIRLFGVYQPVYPIKGCDVKKQEDLLFSFQNGSLPLPFNFGYGSLTGKNKSNLIMAVRKKH